MKYETPQVKASTLAIDVIQTSLSQKIAPEYLDGEVFNESVSAYLDWE